LAGYNGNTRRGEDNNTTEILRNMLWGMGWTDVVHLVCQGLFNLYKDGEDGVGT